MDEATSKMQLELDLKKAKFAITKAKAAKEGMDITLMEKEVETIRLKEHKILQDKEIEKKEKEIKELEKKISELNSSKILKPNNV